MTTKRLKNCIHKHIDTVLLNDYISKYTEVFKFENYIVDNELYIKLFATRNLLERQIYKLKQLAKLKLGFEQVTVSVIPSPELKTELNNYIILFLRRLKISNRPAAMEIEKFSNSILEKLNLAGVYARISGKLYGLRHMTKKIKLGTMKYTGNYIKDVVLTYKLFKQTTKGTTGIIIQILKNEQLPGRNLL